MPQAPAIACVRDTPLSNHIESLTARTGMTGMTASSEGWPAAYRSAARPKLA
jgi:hypothetical protein